MTVIRVKNKISAMERVGIARDAKRPNVDFYIESLFTDFFEIKGDRLSNEDASIMGGIANYKGSPVTIIANKKGSNLKENLKYNFGMPLPSGYRKVQRLAKQAEKFNRPIITFIDTPGAYPGVEAESQGQGEAIASCLALFSDIKVPVISIVIGEGGSGGALAIGVCNHMMMLENAIYSILSPEGFASILWKDAARKAEAAEIMKLTSYDLKELGVIDSIILEGEDGILNNKDFVIDQIKIELNTWIEHYKDMSASALQNHRYERFRKF